MQDNVRATTTRCVGEGSCQLPGPRQVQWQWTQLESDLLHVLFGNIGLAFCQGLESILDFITGLDVLGLLVDQEWGVVLQGDIALPVGEMVSPLWDCGLRPLLWPHSSYPCRKVNAASQAPASMPTRALWLDSLHSLGVSISTHSQALQVFQDSVIFGIRKNSSLTVVWSLHDCTPPPQAHNPTLVSQPPNHAGLLTTLHTWKDSSLKVHSQNKVRFIDQAENRDWGNDRGWAWVGVSAMDLWANPARHQNLPNSHRIVCVFLFLWWVGKAFLGSFYPLYLSLQTPTPMMVWPLVFFLPPRIDDIQELLKLGLRFILLHHGQVVIEPSQAGPEIFVAQSPGQILIKMSEEQKHFIKFHREPG